MGIKASACRGVSHFVNLRSGMSEEVGGVVAPVSVLCTALLYSWQLRKQASLKEIYDWMFTIEDSLKVTPMDALRAGRKAEVRRIAQALL